MENWTADNFTLVALAMLKIAYNFWPVIVFAIGYGIWETMDQRPVRVQSKSRNANNPDRDRSYHSGRRHL